ncbi:YciI family protein [Phenylobacterium sp.]|jgi:hypothetical protein|uniref:YciI family protein n=1 Tax=Phenylobacterium sp. TaxID=1871053 RepID=UPI002F3FD93A
MALFVLSCIDRPDSLERRMAAREAHLAYVAAHRDLVRLAGPYLDDEGRMAGSMFVIEAPDRAAVEAFSAADPYVLADLFERVEIRPWRVSVGAIA